MSRFEGSPHSEVLPSFVMRACRKQDCDKMPPATVNCSTLQEQHREDPCHQAELNQMNMNYVFMVPC